MSRTVSILVLREWERKLNFFSALPKYTKVFTCCSSSFYLKLLCVPVLRNVNKLDFPFLGTKHRCDTPIDEQEPSSIQKRKKSAELYERQVYNERSPAPYKSPLGQLRIVIEHLINAP